MENGFRKNLMTHLITISYNIDRIINIKEY